MQWRPKTSSSAKTKAQPKKRQALPPPPPEPPKPAKKVKVSRLHKPADMSLEEWQIELRRQFGREQNFELKNLGEHPVFSEFEVTNPQSAEHLPRPHPRRAAGRQLLLLPRLRHQHPGHLQAHRVHPRRARTQARRRGQLCRPAFSRRTARSTCNTARAARCASGPAASVPSSWPGWPAEYFDADGALLPEAFAPLRRRSSPRRGQLDHELRCHDDVLAFIAEVRDAERRRAARRRGVPARHPQRRLQGPAQGAALRLPARGRPVRRPGRPLPDRRRNGPGQDDPGHRRRRDHGPAVRRRARADRLPDLAQAPVGARDRALHRPHRRGHRRPAARRETQLRRPTRSSRSPTTTPSTATST